MSDDIKKALETALSRIASLETEVSGYRSRKQEPTLAQLRDEIRKEMVRDPYGAMAGMGVPADYVTKRLVAKQMQEANIPLPDELQGLALLGPQLNATHALESKLEQLSRQVSSIVDTSIKSSARQSIQALSADKAKYPNLAKAAAADPDLINEALEKHGGTAEEFAAAEEARLARVAKLYAPAVSQETTSKTDVQSKQDAPATAANLNGEMPSVNSLSQSLDARRAANKAEIIKKYGDAASSQ